MSNIELLEMRESSNYNISKGMIDVSKKNLDILAGNYSTELNDINDEIYRNITISMFTLLEENNAVTKGTQEVLYENSLGLRTTLQKKTLELIQISTSLSSIIDEKMNHQLLSQIKQDGSTTNINLDEYVDKTVKAGQVLSTSSFPDIEREIDTYNKKIVDELKVAPGSAVAIKIQERLDSYKKIYLYRLGTENKIMFGNFANLVSKTGIYLGNYAKSVDELLASRTVNVSVDELGVPKERKSLAENLGYARELYTAEPQRTI